MLHKLLLFSFFIYSSCYGQAIHYPFKQAYSGLVVYSKNFKDVFSFSANQAGLSQVSSAAAGVCIENRYFLNELKSVKAAIVLPTEFGGIGMSVNSGGYSDFNESALAIAYGKSLGRIGIGIQFTYYALRIAGYGGTHTLLAEGGIIVDLTDRVQFGFHIFNPFGGKLNNNASGKLSAIYETGMGFEVSEKFFIGAAIIKEEDQAVNVHAGFHYSFAKRLFLCTGINTDVTKIYMGVGIQLKKIRLNIVSSHHPQLGLSPVLSISWERKREE